QRASSARATPNAPPPVMDPGHDSRGTTTLASHSSAPPRCRVRGARVETRAVSLADADIVHDLDRTPGASAGASRAAALAELVAAVQTRPGHVIVIAQDAKAAAGLFSEAEARFVTHRAVRVRGRALD